MNRVNRKHQQYNYQRHDSYRHDSRAEDIRRVQLSLPVFKYKREIMDKVKKHPIILIVGETGSGKTTQIPQYLLEWDQISTQKRIVCTQPRTVAATSVARRVTEEVGESKEGGTVGYHIRLDRCVSARTKLEYMTEGVLLRKAQSRDNLSEYGVVIVDEAHERTVNADLLMGFLKEMVTERSDLRVIIMSATLDTERFRKYFDSPPLISVPGSANPVQHHWLQRPTENYLSLTVEVIKAIHLSPDAVESLGDDTVPDGHILAFLTGQSEIERVTKELEGLNLRSPNGHGLEVFALYAALNVDERKRAFAEPRDRRTRKVVVATNIAETSLTISNVVYVVDCGLSKQRVYSPSKGVEILGVRQISKASVKQRVGRAGRVKPGVAYHLYTERGYIAFPNETPPEILRSGLVSEILAMLALGIENPLKFDFIDPPDEMTMARALHILRNLGAIDRGCRITDTGRRMARFPVSPRMAKSLLAAYYEFDCVHEMVTVAAMMEIEDRLWWKPPPEHRARAKEAKAQFFHSSGDHLTLLNVFNAYCAVRDGHSRDQRGWAQDHFLNLRSLKRCGDIRKQIERTLARIIQHSENNAMQQIVFKVHRIEFDKYYENILKALLSGHFMNIAVKGFGEHFWRFRLVSLDADGKEKAVDVVDKAKAHQSSIFEKHRAPNWAIYDEVVWTHSPMLKTITAIKPMWLHQIHSNGYFDAKALVNDQTPIGKVLTETARFGMPVHGQ